jgi:spore maturation protein CgeB
MKILVIGSDRVYAIENFYIKHLRALGAEVVLFPAQNYFYDFYQKNILNKLVFRSGLSKIIGKINAELKRQVLTVKPEIVWVFKGMEVLPETLVWIRSEGIKIVNYNPDNPFLFSGKGSGNSNISNSIGIYDLHFSYDESIRRRLEDEFGKATYSLPFGFEVNDHLYEVCSNQKEQLKACFLGNPDVYRAGFLQEIADFVPIDVYGNNWKKFINHKNVSIFKPVYGLDLWKALYRYRVQLNLMRPHNPESHNMRSFEVPGIGGILLAPDTPDHREYFNVGNEIFLYSDNQSCINQIHKILDLPSNEADSIRSAARQGSVKKAFSYKDRAAYVLDIFERMLAGDA